MNLKYFIFILVVVTAISTNSFSQKKRKAVKEIKTDTISVFSQLEEQSFSERNVYWSDKNEIGIIYSQGRNLLDWDTGYLIKLTVVFYHLDLIHLNKPYNLSDLHAECEIKSTFGRLNFNAPTGQIIFVDKTNDRLTFQFDVKALSTDRRELLFFKGVREFVPDY